MNDERRKIIAAISDQLHELSLDLVRVHKEELKFYNHIVLVPINKLMCIESHQSMRYIAEAEIKLVDAMAALKRARRDML